MLLLPSRSLPLSLSVAVGLAPCRPLVKKRTEGGRRTRGARNVRRARRRAAWDAGRTSATRGGQAARGASIRRFMRLQSITSQKALVRVARAARVRNRTRKDGLGPLIEYRLHKLDRLIKFENTCCYRDVSISCTFHICSENISRCSRKKLLSF